MLLTMLISRQNSVKEMLEFLKLCNKKTPVVRQECKY